MNSSLGPIPFRPAPTEATVCHAATRVLHVLFLPISHIVGVGVGALDVAHHGVVGPVLWWRIGGCLGLVHSVVGLNVGVWGVAERRLIWALVWYLVWGLVVWVVVLGVGVLLLLLLLLLVKILIHQNLEGIEQLFLIDGTIRVLVHAQNSRKCLTLINN